MILYLFLIKILFNFMLTKEIIFYYLYLKDQMCNYSLQGNLNHQIIINLAKQEQFICFKHIYLNSINSYFFMINQELEFLIQLRVFIYHLNLQNEYLNMFYYLFIWQE